MSVPRRSNADGFSINVLNAILERPVETTTTTSMEEEEEENIDHREHPPIQRRKSFLDSTSISTSSKVICLALNFLTGYCSLLREKF
uniref:Wsv294 n=1 Tax=Caenorhabditis tropicalis TaxID=1561998 RepID=A0A1I7U4Z8_9PELO